MTRTEYTLTDTSPRLLVFDHIPKCGGTTFCDLLTRMVGEEPYSLCYNVDYCQLADTPGRGHFLTGHQTWGAHAFWPQTWQAVYVTFIRNPLNVAVSSYKYRAAKEKLQIGLNEYIYDIDPNFLTRHLGGGDLERARQRLFETYVGFGVVEQFERSVHYLLPLLGFPRAAVDILNASPPEEIVLEQGVKDRFIRMNADDFALYNEALEKLMDRTPYFKSKAQPGKRVHLTKKMPALYQNILEQNDVQSVYKMLIEHKFEGLDWEDSWYLLRFCIDSGLVYETKNIIEEVVDVYSVHKFDFYLIECYDLLGCPKEGDRILQNIIERLGRFPPTSEDAFLTRNVAALTLDMAQRHWNAGREEEAGRSIAFYIERFLRAEEDLVLLARWLCHAQRYRLVQEIVLPRLPMARSVQARLAVHASLASAAYGLDRLDQARAHCAEVLSLDPLHYQALQMTLVLDRREGRPLAHQDQARAFCQALAGLALADRMRRELAVNLSEAGQEEEAWSLLGAGEAQGSWREEAARLEAAGLPVLPFGELAGSGEVLVVRTGPWLLARHLLRECFGPLGLPVDLMGRVPEGPGKGDTQLIRRVLPLPWDGGGEAGQYDLVVLLLASVGDLAPGRLTSLAWSLSRGRVAAFTFEQLVAGRFRSGLLVLDRPEAHPRPNQPLSPANLGHK